MFLALLLACTPDPDDTGDPDPIVAGAFCDADELLGEVVVSRWGDGPAGFSARLQDAPDPRAAPPSATSGACSFYEFSASYCEGCASPKVCSAEGECVDPPRAVTALELVLTADGVESSHHTDELGNLWGDAGAATRFAFELTWPGGHVVSEEMELPTGLSATVSAEGDPMAPGALTASWSGSEQGWVATSISINHHAGAYTYTECRAEAVDGGFVAPAEMIDPLAVVTGLEFQGLTHGEHAAAEVEGGCVQVSVFTELSAYVEYEEGARGM
jgi:hypothetical protein